MKILITGGAGFIGAHLIKKILDRGDQPVVIDNFNNYYDIKLKKDRLKKFLKDYSFKTYKIDIREREKLEKIFKKEKIQKVVHLAAMAGVRYSVKKPFLYEEVNIKGTMNIFDLSVKYKVDSVVYASSSSVYGGNKKLPFSEDDPVNNQISFYGATKRSTEILAQVYNKIHNLKTAGLRYFTVYGPWGRPDLAYFIFTGNIIEQKPIKIHNFGKMGRNFTYIDDAIEATLKVMDYDFGCQLYNIGGEKEIDLMEFIEVLEKILDKKAQKKFIPIKPGEIVKTAADIKKIKKLGWRPETKFEKGMENFVKWYKKYY
ncbi:MAG: NAD-dependent epimerase/dehydratase family protein [Candidatus Moranbacteria bacterium]|nr:NAD-dependent epimerase/dehydratase family protein [Candidatus Moranbacteria bacterium]